MKINKNWFKSFFKKDFYNFDFIPQKRTLQEVDFIIKASGIKNGDRILDVPCGVGRHSLILANKGFFLTSVDFSKEYLSEAIKKAKRMKLKNIEFIRNDMRNIDFEGDFDLVINMFTSFGYFDDRDNFNFLKKVHRALKKDGKFIIDVKNGVFIRKNLSEKNWEIAGDVIELQEFVWIDKNTLKNTWHKIEDGKMKTRTFCLKMYDKKSLSKILKKAGFKVLKIYGGFDFSKVTDESKRIIAVCEKV